MGRESNNQKRSEMFIESAVEGKEGGRGVEPKRLVKNSNFDIPRRKTYAIDYENDAVEHKNEVIKGSQQHPSTAIGQSYQQRQVAEDQR